MAPEVYVRKEPKEGLQPDGAVRIEFNGNIGRLVRYREHLSGGIGMVFRNREDVTKMVIKLAQHVKLGSEETEERRPELIKVVTAAFSNNGSFGGDEEELYARFTHEEIQGVGEEAVMIFASQEVVNETFLKLLPHSKIVGGHNISNDADDVRIVLGPLNLLAPDVLRQLSVSVVVQGNSECRGAALRTIYDIADSLAEKE